MDTQRFWTRLKDLRALGPYILIELLLPGGTLLAFLLWLSQRLRRDGLHRSQRAAAPHKQVAIMAGRQRSAAEIDEAVGFDAGCPVAR